MRIKAVDIKILLLMDLINSLDTKYPAKKDEIKIKILSSLQGNWTNEIKGRFSHKNLEKGVIKKITIKKLIKKYPKSLLFFPIKKNIKHNKTMKILAIPI